MLEKLLLISRLILSASGPATESEVPENTDIIIRLCRISDQLDPDDSALPVICSKSSLILRYLRKRALK